VTQRMLVLAMVGLLASFPVSAQQAGQQVVVPIEPAKAADPEHEIVPLEIQVVVSRVQDTKKISSLPYALAVNASIDRPPSQLRMGASVPIAQRTSTEANMPSSVNYQEIGTNIDCRARPVGDGRFEVWLSVQDTSVYPNLPGQTIPTVGDMVALRRFQVSNSVVLRDGQTRQFTAATDRVSGEIVRIDVTLRVVK
jgi:hypothetical protein